jgi:hypothetical protein
LAALLPDHPGHYEGLFCSGSRVLASGAMFAGLALVLGGGHLAIAAIAALPFAAKVSHLVMPELLRRYGSGRIASMAIWLERAGFLIAAAFGVIRPAGLAMPGLLAGFALGALGQALYDGSMTALHSEATSADTVGRYTAAKTRWASGGGLVLGVLASLAIDTTERMGVPAHVARALAIACGVGVHLLITGHLRRLIALASRRVAEEGAEEAAPLLPTPTTPRSALARQRSWVVFPRTAEQWTLTRFALAWGFAMAISARQGEAMALSLLGVSVGTIMLLNAVAVGAAVIGAKWWGMLGDRFGGKGLMSIALAGLALDPLWWLASLFLHPAFLVLGYLLFGVFNGGWNITISMTLVRNSGGAGERIRAFMLYSVAFGIAAGVAPLLGGGLLDVVEARYGSVVAYATLFGIAAVLRASVYPWLRRVPAPEAEAGRYVSAVVLRAVRRGVLRRSLVPRFGRPAPSVSDSDEQPPRAASA